MKSAPGTPKLAAWSKKTMTYIVGLTGGIGSGKTAVSDCFAALGITVVDADVCARIVVEPGRPALQSIVEHFGSVVLNSDGSLDRAQLRQIIFADETARKWLETLLHPLIFDEMWSQLQSAESPYAILASPLLVEAGQSILCQRVLVVDVSEDIQLQRAVARDANSEEQIKAIMASQTSREARLQKADDIIINDKDFAHLDEQVQTLHRRYLQLAY
jgi:dephospho-CoA kinase